MLNVIKTKLHAGLSSPVKILHVTDVHLTYADGSDPQEQRDLMVLREKTFYAPPYTTKEYLEQAFDLAEKEGALLVCTGDAIDVHTNGNVSAFKNMISGKDLMFVPGGHERQRICVKTMEEPYPFAEKISAKLQEEFSEFDLSFQSREINGLNVIAVDNGLDYFSRKTVEAFKRELQKGLPVLVFFHDPLNDSYLLKTSPYDQNIKLTAEDYAISHEMIKLLTEHPLVVTTISGHEHVNQEYVINGKTHYITDGLFRGCARLIEID